MTWGDWEETVMFQQSKQLGVVLCTDCHAYVRVGLFHPFVTLEFLAGLCCDFRNPKAENNNTP